MLVLEISDMKGFFMKILRLRLKNINSFRREIELDFEKEPLNEASLFAITGPTGSGKTTLLDALCVSLYNKTPRLDGRGNKNTYNLLNQNSDEGFSEVLFEANGKRYISEWTVNRTSKGELKQSAKLIEAETQKLISDRITSRKGNPSVEESVTNILNLDFGAFNRSIMLAQGEFAAFLKAEPERKREILEATTGMDIYEQLKEMLNKKTNDMESKYNESKSAVESIDMVTQEDINNVDEQINQLSKELKQLDNDREQIAVLERKETERTRIHKQLVQVIFRKDGLLKQENQIEQLENEIHSARKAADIKTLSELYEKDKQSLNKIEKELKVSETTLENAKKEHQKAQADFIKANENYEKMRKDSERKTEEINAAANIEVEANTYLVQAEKQLDDIKKLNQEISQIEKAIQEEMDELEKVAEKIRTAESFLNANPIPENSERLLMEASAIVTRITELKRTSKEKVSELRKKEENQEKLQSQLQELEKQLTELKSQLGLAEKSFENAQKELNSLLKKGSEEYWEKQKQKSQKAQDCASKYEKTVADLDENRSSKEQTQISLKELQDELSKVSEETESVTKEVDVAEEKVKRCEAEHRYALIANQVAILRKEHLQKDKPCPVCGSNNHPWADKQEPEAEILINEARDNLSNAKNELTKLTQKLSRLDKKQSGLEAKKTELQKDLEQYIEKAEKIEKEKISAEKQWYQFYPDEQISSNFLKIQLSEAEDYIKKISSAKTALQESQNKKQLLSQKLESNQISIDNNKQQLKQVQEESQKLNNDIEASNNKLEKFESDFWEIIPPDFQISSPEKAINKLESRISDVKKKNEQLDNARVKRERLNASIESKESRLASEKKRLQNMVSQEKDYRKKGEELLALAKSKTGGLKAEDARKKLKLELEVSEKNKNEMQEIWQNKREELKQAEISADNMKELYNEAIQKFNNTQNDYFVALKNAGFDSPEEHKNLLKKPEWIEESQKKLEDYRKELHSVEERIAELEANFKDEPYELHKLDIIQKKLQSLDNNIKDKVDKRGNLRRRKEELQENFEKRKKLEKELEVVKNEYDRWIRLKSFIPENRLRDFALKSMFDLLVSFANSKLEELTGRYVLKVKDMKDMTVIDKWNAGEERPVETLSGGETFLTSLSLALALSELSKGRTELDSLFLDEGFGTLDSETLDIALATLESLRLSGRTIGVISHVRELTRRIPVRIAVKKLGDGSSNLDLHKS